MELQISDSSNFALSCPNDTHILDNEMSTLTTEIKNDEQGTTCTATITSVSVRRVRVVVSFVGKLVLPAVVGVYYAYLRNKHTLVEVLPAVVAFLTNGIARSLSSVQGAVTSPTIKFDPILRVIKLRYRPIAECDNKPLENSSENINDPIQSDQEVDETPKPCVTCNILTTPPPGQEIRVDIVFVHGLHGSLVKTWRQGEWKMAKDRAASVELRRRASTSCLQSSKPRTQSLKRSASTNSDSPRTRSKIAKDQFGERTTCGCPGAVCHCTSDDTLEKVCEVVEEPSGAKEENAVFCNGGEQKSECWPRDWLPIDVPDARVIALSYTTDPYLWRPVWIKQQIRTSMETRCNEMMEKLLKLGVGKNPIVWVGHSKGGLFVKQILVDAWERRTKEPLLADLCLQTKAIMFFSVPHRGSTLADFNLPLIRRSVELLEIGRDCDKVLDLHKKFLNLFDDEKFNPEIFSFIETSLTFMAFLCLRIVTFESADPGVGVTWGVPLDHREICKPTSRNCFLYQELVDLIRRST